MKYYKKMKNKHIKNKEAWENKIDCFSEEKSV